MQRMKSEKNTGQEMKERKLCKTWTAVSISPSRNEVSSKFIFSLWSVTLLSWDLRETEELIFHPTIFESKRILLNKEASEK